MGNERQRLKACEEGLEGFQGEINRVRGEIFKLSKLVGDMDMRLFNVEKKLLDSNSDAGPVAPAPFPKPEPKPEPKKEEPDVRPAKPLVSRPFVPKMDPPPAKPKSAVPGIPKNPLR